MHQHYQSYCQIKQGKLKLYLPRRIEAAAKGKKTAIILNLSQLTAK